MRRQTGFTLIELMIVIAIIAILATIAIPAYQMYATRSQIAAALAEIAAGKSAFESELIADSVAVASPEDIGLQSNTPRCATSIDSSPTGFIRCTMKGNPVVNGKTLTLQRTVEGLWHCQVQAEIPTRYWPSPCT